MKMAAAAMIAVPVDEVPARAEVDGTGSDRSDRRVLSSPGMAGALTNLPTNVRDHSLSTLFACLFPPREDYICKRGPARTGVAQFAKRSRRNPPIRRHHHQPAKRGDNTESHAPPRQPAPPAPRIAADWPGDLLAAFRTNAGVHAVPTARAPSDWLVCRCHGSIMCRVFATAGKNATDRRNSFSIRVSCSQRSSLRSLQRNSMVMYRNAGSNAPSPLWPTSRSWTSAIAAGANVPHAPVFNPVPAPTTRSAPVPTDCRLFQTAPLVLY